MEENMEWEEIQPNIWKPENPGDAIEGILIGKESEKGDYKSSAYALETKQGQFLVWGSAVIDERMKYVDVGEKVKIMFEGKENNKKGQPVNIFKIFRGKKIE